MSEPASGRWEQIRERRLQAPAVRDRYERTRRSLAAVQQVLELIDERRRESGLSKAELARRVGVNSASMRRLLGSGSGNPTLKTLLDVMDVLDMRMSLTTCEPQGTRDERGSGQTEMVPSTPCRAPLVG